MSVILRLQGLSWSANAMDIRRFFNGLSIPEGGVHIVGGESGDAFIAFTTDEDARQGILLDNGKIKDSRLKLMLSSRFEMQKVIEAARSRNMALQTGTVPIVNPNVVAGNVPPAIGVIGDAPLTTAVSSQLNILSNPFDIPTASATSSQQPSQLVYVNRMALEQQQNIAQPKHSVQVIEYTSNSSSNAPTGAFSSSKNEIRGEREKEGGRGSEGSGRSRDRSRDRLDRSRAKNRRKVRDRSRSPRRSADRDGGVYNRRRSASREEDKDHRRNNNSDRYRDHDSRQEMPGNNNVDMNNSNRFMDQPQPSRRGPSRWNRPESPEPNQQTRDVEHSGSGPGSSSAQSPDNQGVWDKPGGSSIPPVMNEFGGNQMQPSQSRQQQRNQSPPRGTLLMVRGVPFNAMHVHIRVFFTGLAICPDGISFAVDERGERLPVAFVRFTSERDRDLALRRPKQYLNNCVVEVMPASEDDLRNSLGGNYVSENIKGGTNNNSNLNNMGIRNCIVLQGLPAMVREGDVVRFLAGFNLQDVLIKYDNVGKTTGLCFVELSDPREAERCLEMNGQMMGPRRIEINVITKEELDTQRTESRESRNMGGNFGGGGGGNGPMPRMQGGFSGDEREIDCCLVRGLPFSADNRDVYEFFAPTGCTPAAIHLMKDNNDRASGDAVCEFANPRQCSIALQQDGAPFRPGSRAILMVKPITRRELDDAIMSYGHPNNMNNNFNNRDGPMQARSSDAKFGLLGPLPNNSRFNNSFPGPNFNNGPRFNGPNSQQGMMDHEGNRGLPMMDDGGGGGGGRRSPPCSPPQQMPPQFNRNQGGGVNNIFGRPGTVIEVTNIPYRASTEDILDFFKGFSLLEDDVIRKYNNRGQPAGEARVLFQAREDAQSAVRRLADQCIMGRNVALSII